MADPTVPTAAVYLAAQAAAVPVLTVAGISLGLRADVLMAGFGGAVAAITLLNSVPADGDTVRALLRTSAKRVGVAIGSAVVAGYIAPLLALINGVPDLLMLSVAFVAGAGAPQMLPWLIDRFARGRGTTDAGGP